jgi:hypothetical protein
LVKALETIAVNSDRLIKKEAITADVKTATIVNIQTLDSIEKSIATADLVVKAVPRCSACLLVAFRVWLRLLEILYETRCFQYPMLPNSIPTKY